MYNIVISNSCSTNVNFISQVTQLQFRNIFQSTLLFAIITSKLYFHDLFLKILDVRQNSCVTILLHIFSQKYYFEAQHSVQVNYE
jgi:hypothetical protein